MARPPSTYEGRTSTGYPMRAATATASAAAAAIPPGGSGIPARSHTRLTPSRTSPIPTSPVLRGQRLEEQPIAGVVVGGDGLGVAVHHHGLEAGFGEREGRVDAAVVELDTLPDAVRSAPEDDHGGPFERRDLVFVLVGSVV